METFNCFLSAFSNTGVSFVMSVVVQAKDAMDAGNRACKHVMEHGGQITLMIGAPPVPVQVAYATPQRVDKVVPTSMIEMPGGGLIKH